MGKTNIEWADFSFNPWLGCEKISPACDHCYAESWAKRAGRAGLWKGERQRTRPENWAQLAKWDRAAAKAGRRDKVFVASLADVFDNKVPEEWRADLFREISSCTSLDFLLLTKRIGNARAMLNSAAGAALDAMPGAPVWDRNPWSNVWIGDTVCNQAEADRDIHKLRALPARVRFLSIEPMLGRITADLSSIDWVICGGESGGGARPLEVEWATHLRWLCHQYGAAFFMKQGSQANWPNFKNFDTFPEDLRVREWPQVSA